LYGQRLTIADGFGLSRSIDASKADTIKKTREWTEGRGADAVVLAVAGTNLIRTAMESARPGGRVMLFAQTARGEAVIDPAAICVDEKSLLGSYSASIELQKEAVDFVCRGEMNLERLISHRYSLSNSVEALELAAHPRPESMKVVIQPGMEPES
jgi:L-iditol 2-dehydrogenase